MLSACPDVYKIIFDQMDVKTVIAASSVSKLFYRLYKQICKAKLCICTVKIWLGVPAGRKLYHMSWEIGEFASELPHVAYDDVEILFGFHFYLYCDYLLSLEQINNILTKKDNKLRKVDVGRDGVLNIATHSPYHGKLIDMSHCPHGDYIHVPITIDTQTAIYNVIRVGYGRGKCISDMHLTEKKENWANIILPSGIHLVDNSN